MDRKIFSVFFCFVVLSSMAMATSIPNTSNNPRTFLGPSASLSITKSMSEDSAFSIAGEGGPKIVRLDGTLGWDLNYYQRIKASAEFLREKLTYSFFDGRQSAWMNQGALGLDYQYDFRETVPYNTKIDLAGYLSHAPSRNLGTSSGVFNNHGVLTNYTVVHRIAGSNGAGVSPGVTITPWEGTDIGFKVNYDSVRYDTIYRHSANAKGFGGTVFLNQNIVDDVDLGLSAAVRAPFNDYEGNISWGNIPYYDGLWRFKIYGAYTIGKNTLPTTYDIGIGADFLADAIEHVQSAPPPPSMPLYKDMRYKDMPRVYKDQGIVPPAEWENIAALNIALLKWVAVPAVRMPTVLTVADGKVTTTAVAVCVPPSFTGCIGNGGFCDIDFGTPFTYDLTANFSGSDLTFTITATTPANNGSLTISGSTLIGNGPAGGGGSPPFYPGGSFSAVTITATNACGSAVSNTFGVE